MEGYILDLYHRVSIISKNFLDHEKRKDLVPVQECLEDVQKFAVWFMEENRLDEENDIWEGLKTQLLVILQDMVQAIEEGDYVLMHDALAYGLMEYLEIFLPPVSKEEGTDDTV